MYICINSIQRNTIKQRDRAKWWEKERGRQTEKWFLILGSRDRANSQKILIIPELCSPTKITRLLFSFSSFIFCCFSLSISHSFALYSLRFGFVRLRFYSISFVAVFFLLLFLSSSPCFHSLFVFALWALVSVHMLISQQTVIICSSSL